MHKHAPRTLVAVLVSVCAVLGLVAATARESAHGAPLVTPSCQLGNGSGQIKHVIYLQFDNTHYRRDRPDIASDLEQMPHLLNFMQQNGTLFTNDHTILISHTAGGILSSLTGLYPDRGGPTVSNSYGFFKADGTVGFSSTFKYWNDFVDATLDPLPNMITDGQKNTPAPWVPFTRDGCDVGGVGTANIELENTSTNATGDMTRVFGPGSPEWLEAQANPQLAQTDFVGIAVHCSQSTTSVCHGNANAKPDSLPDEPGGYSGFDALYGAKYVNPAITGGKACVNNTAGTPVQDPKGNCGFPGFDGMEATNTLGYVAQMQENGVPVTYGYISDAHDIHVPNTGSDSFVSTAAGPGQYEYEQQLKAYDDAFAAFFTNLSAHGIDKSNTLFVITVDEGDHFAGGIGTPDAAHPGALAYTHTNCAANAQGILNNCPSNQVGEVNANLQPLTGRTDFAVHSDDAPTFYLTGNPAPSSTPVRSLEHTLTGMKLSDPYVNNGQQVPVAVNFADPVEEATLHMVNTDPARTPSFTMFGNDDIFFTAASSGPTCGSNPCVSPSFAWNHGDIQEEIGNTWVGMVGPGVGSNGVNSTTWTDHTNLRPTIMALTGLKDDYTEDGVVLSQALTPAATPPALNAQTQQLGQLYEQLNAPFGQFGSDTLKASTNGIESDVRFDSVYHNIEAAIQLLTAQRNALAGQIHAGLQAAEFSGQPVNPGAATVWELKGATLLAQARALAIASGL